MEFESLDILKYKVVKKKPPAVMNHYNLLFEAFKSQLQTRHAHPCQPKTCDAGTEEGSRTGLDSCRTHQAFIHMNIQRPNLIRKMA